MDYFSAAFSIPLLEIIWIDILLSGDNAVVIAMACRSLPAHRQKLGIGLGAATAVILRIIFATIITQLLAVPYLRIAGGALLLWIAIKLVKAEEEDENHVAAHETLFGAVRTIALADLVMSLDNVVAVAAASKGHIQLFVIGLLISIPFVVGGASLISGLIQRFPALIWFGGALLGWISGEMIASDPLVIGLTQGGSAAHGSYEAYIAPVLGAAIVVAVGQFLSRRKTRDRNARECATGSE
ncbi:YjbE family putative metal transport protein [Rhodoblastus acidophilus]|uniref:YjbE family putative metal transport protein n=1 Tax=Rhodoblastus acidophilus TaxID=1074 RepID=A0A6N8DMS5_RHOAC|nr:TerC family protein [Rhodoblastus acidophilus]MCW2275663.1 YjbE family integral membrane protein [Rhodoblastus acidophilus]MTV31830.1 YjbE family putative metal transport protein [Rhodoblastus acidophilus]